MGEEDVSDPKKQEEGKDGNPKERPREEEIGLEERRLINALKSFKEGNSILKMDLLLQGRKMDVEDIEWIASLKNKFKYK